MTSRLEIGVFVLLFVLGLAFVTTIGGSLTDWYDDYTHVAQRSGLNLVSGAGMEIVCDDEPTDSRVSCLVSAVGSGGSVVVEEDNSAVDAAATNLDFGSGLDVTGGAGEADIVIDPTEFGANWIDAVTDLAAGIRTGADLDLVTGTAGASGNCVEWNVDGDVVDSGGVCGGAGSGDSIEVEDGDNAGTFSTVDTTARFDDSGDCNFALSDGGAGGPDAVTCTIRVDSVALGTDTTGNYAGSSSEGGAATTATALAANPTDCGANTFADAIAANGDLTCNGVVDADVSDTLTVGNAGTVDADALACDVGDDDLISADCIGDVLTADNITDIYLLNSGDATTGDLDHNDGVTDSPKSTFTPATGTAWDIYAEDTGDDLQIEVTTASEEVLDIVNTGAGTVRLSLDGGVTLSAFDCTGNANGGALTADASGVVSCSDDDGGAGGGDSVTVNSVAADTTANLLDGDIDWTLVDGGAGGPDDVTATVACTDCVALTTETSGNYTASIADAGNTTITVVNGVAEGGAVTLDAVDVNCTGCLGTTEVAGLDISADTNLTCGRSLTVSGDGCDADAELYTDTKGVWFEDPVDTDDFQSIWIADGYAVTLTRLWCESDQTVTLMLQVDDDTPADVDSVDLVCISTPDTDVALDGDATMASGDRLDLAVTSVSGTPTWVSIMWTFTIDE